MKWRASIAALALSVTTPLACAHEQEQPQYDQVDFSVTAEREVPNDLLVVVLYAEQQGQRQAEVADKVNTAIAWALEQVRAASAVRAQTLQYGTYPIYANNATAITGWRARQSLRLESADTRALGDLLGALQGRLAIETVGYQVSQASRDAAEKGLTSEALTEFQARAAQIAAALGRGGYRVVRINLSAGGEAPRPVPYRAAVMLAEQAAPAPPQLESGVQTLTVTAAGTIQLDARP
jgi:predicted secreted protein